MGQRRIDRLASELMDRLQDVVEDFCEDNPDTWNLSVEIDVKVPPRPKREKRKELESK